MSIKRTYVVSLYAKDARRIARACEMAAAKIEDEKLKRELLRSAEKLRDVPRGL